MTFPAVSSITKSRQDSDVTTSSAAYPGTVASGDLAILLVGMDGNATAPNFSGTGMTGIESAQYGSVVGQGAAYKVCTGSEGGTTEDWTHGTAQTCSMMLIIAGFDSGTAPSSTAAGSSTSAATADPPSDTPSWSSEDTLWIAFGVHNSAPDTVSAYPTNYSVDQDEDSNTAAAGVTVAVATRELNTAGAEDPGTFTFGDSVAWAAVTVAVRPIAYVLEQEGFRWRADDGSESAASWLASQDVDISIGKNTTVRLRVAVDYTGNPGAGTFTLKYKRSDEADTEKRTIN